MGQATPVRGLPRCLGMDSPLLLHHVVLLLYLRVRISGLRLPPLDVDLAMLAVLSWAGQ